MCFPSRSFHATRRRLELERRFSASSSRGAEDLIWLTQIELEIQRQPHQPPFSEASGQSSCSTSASPAWVTASITCRDDL